MEKQKLAVVGIFYDGYYDLWEDFLELFSENWTETCYKLYIVNNLRELDYEKNYDVTVLHAGSDAEYSRKVQMAMEKINADYYLLLLEDFLMEAPAERGMAERIIRFMERNDLSYYRMQMPEFIPKGIPQFRLLWSGRHFVPKGVDKRKSVKNKRTKVKPTDEYTVACQPSIWKKDFLAKCIGRSNYNAWIFEGIYCYSKYAHTKEFTEQCCVDYANPLNFRHLAVQGKLLPDVYKDFAGRGYKFKTQREFLDTDAYRRYMWKKRLKALLPLRVQKMIKRIIVETKRIVRTDSIIEKYRSQILEEMELLNIQ